jgi:hypothetical protein
MPSWLGDGGVSSMNVAMPTRDRSRGGQSRCSSCATPRRQNGSPPRGVRCRRAPAAVTCFSDPTGAASLLGHALPSTGQRKHSPCSSSASGLPLLESEQGRRKIPLPSGSRRRAPSRHRRLARQFCPMLATEGGCFKRQAAPPIRGCQEPFAMRAGLHGTGQQPALTFKVYAFRE